MPAEIDASSRKLLEEPNFAFVATLMPDGAPQVTPTWIDVEDSTVLFNTAEGRQKPKNLRRDPRVTIAVPNRENFYEYVEIRGRVVEDTHEGADEHVDRLAKKYLGQDTYPFRQPGEERVIFKIEPERVRYYGG